MRVDYYTKYGCSLCDEGLFILRSFPEIDINIIDVEDDIEKYHSYLLRIPVISYGNEKNELGWPFGEKDIETIVSSVKFQVPSPKIN